MKPKSRFATWNSNVISICLGVGIAIVSHSAQGATYTYSNTTSNTSGTATAWSSGTNWSATPVSASDTTLTFNGTLAASATIFSNNDISGNFLLNALNFTAAGPGSGTAPVETTSGNKLEFLNNGGTAPVLTINSTGTVKPLLVINNDILLNNSLTVAATTAGTLSGVVSGTNTGLTKTQAGVLTLTNANTYTGATTVTQGTLNLSGTGAVASSAITLGSVGAGNVTSQLTITPSLTSGTVTRAASLSVNGSNLGGNNARELVITGVAANTSDVFTGALNLNSGGTFVAINTVAGGNAALTFGSLTRNVGTVLNVNSSPGTNTIASLTSNSSNIIFSTAPTLTGGGGAAGSTTVSILPYLFINNNVGTYDSTNGLRSLTNAEQPLLTSGMAAGQNTRVTGATTLATNTSINSVQIASTLNLGGFTLSVTGGAIIATLGSTIGASQNDGIVDFGSQEGFLGVANSRSLTMNSVIAGSGGLTVDIVNFSNSNAFLVLNGSNTYTGVTTFNGNNTGLQVRLTNSLALQNSTLDYNNYGANLIFGNGTTTGQTAYTFGGLKGAQNINLNNNNTVVGAVALTLGSAGSADTSSTVNTYSGVLSNTVAGGSIIKAGVATQVLSGANTYSGTTTISAGSLVAGTNALVSAAGAFGNASSAIVIGDAATTTNNSSASLLTGGAFTIGRAVTIADQATSGTYTIGGNTDNNSTFSNQITANQNFSVSQVATTSTNALSITGGITSGNAGAKTVTFNNAGTVNVTTTGISDGTGTLAVTQSGSGTTTLSASNSYTGVTTITGGKLSVGTIGNGGVAGNLGQASNAAANLVFDGGTLKYTGSSVVSDRAFTINASKTATIEVTTGETNLSLAGATGAATNGLLTKTGGGTLTLTGSSTYNGISTISAGKLVMGDAATDTFATSQVNVASGATLGGSGTLAGNVSLAAESVAGLKDGGTLAAGNSPGVLTASGTTAFNTGSIFSWDIGTAATGDGIRGTDYDGVNTTSLSGTGAVFQIVLQGADTFASAFWDRDHSWSDIFKSADGTASLTGWASVFQTAGNTNFSYVGGTPGVEGAFSLTNGTLSWSAVPEPTSAVAGFLLGAGLLRRRRCQKSGPQA